jgi:hypothetical protein
MQPPVSIRSPVLEKCGVHGNYKASVPDWIDQKLAQVQLLFTPSAGDADGLGDFDEEGLAVIAGSRKEIRSPPNPPRYAVVGLCPPEEKKPESAPKRQKVADPDDVLAGLSSSSEHEKPAPVPQTNIPSDTLSQIYGAFNHTTPDPVVVAAPAQVIGDEDYASESEGVKPKTRPAREKKTIDRYSDEDQVDDEDEGATKKPTVKRKAKDPVVLKDVEKIDTGTCQPFSILRNPENIQRMKLVKCALKPTKALTYEQLDTCNFANKENHKAWKVWYHFFRQAVVTAFAIHCQCPELIASTIKENPAHSHCLSEWIAEIRLQIEDALRGYDRWEIPPELPEKACRILAFVPQYHYLEFTTSKNQEQYFVLFRHPLDYRHRVTPEHREFQVTASQLSQILQLHCVLYPLEMMVEIAQSTNTFASTADMTRAQKTAHFKSRVESYITENERHDLSNAALHAFKVWWFYQSNLQISLAETLIADRIKDQTPHLGTPTLAGRRRVGI